MSKSSMLQRVAVRAPLAGCVATLASQAGAQTSSSAPHATREEFRDSLAQVLTPGQMKEWDALRDEAMAKAHERRSGK